MKKIFMILGVMVVLSVNAHAQNYSHQLKQRAEAGNVSSQVSLGECYYFGYGIETDYEEAFRWFKKAAEKGNAQAQYYVGFGYINGNIGETDYAVGLEYLQKAKQQGNKYAQDAYQEITNTSCDKWGDSFNHYSTIYEGFEAGTDYEIKIKADKGSGFYCLQYALACVNSDNVEALRYFQKACQLLDTEQGKKELAQLERIDKEDGLIDFHFSMALTEAKTWLALCYEWGVGTDKDINKALKLYIDINGEDYYDFSRSWTQYHYYFPYMRIGIIYKSLGQIEKAIKVFEGLAIPSSYLKIAEIYLERRDYTKAFNVLMKAIQYDRGSGMGLEVFEEYPTEYADACYKIAEMYRQGLGVEKNLRKAEVYAKTALKYGSPCAIAEFANK